MGLRKCPKCELNYIREGEDLCDVCKRSMKKDADSGLESVDGLCVECGENPAVRGSEYCAQCLREMRRQTVKKKVEEDLDTAAIGLDLLDDIEVPIEDTEDIPETEMEEIDRELGDGLDDEEDEMDTADEVEEDLD